jgi:hypothetical protein
LNFDVDVELEGTVRGFRAALRDEVVIRVEDVKCDENGLESDLLFGWTIHGIS